MEQGELTTRQQKDGVWKIIKVGDVCKVKKSKYLNAGSCVKILMEIQKGNYLCGNKSGNTIIVPDNLEEVEVSS